MFLVVVADGGFLVYPPEGLADLKYVFELWFFGSNHYGSLFALTSYTARKHCDQKSQRTGQVDVNLTRKGGRIETRPGKF
jgi:hypothetical protein